MTRHLMHCLLSTWHWSAITHPMSCPPTPTNMEIGRWLPLDQEGSKEDLWIEAYACYLQRIVEASTGWSWVMEGGGMAPQVSPLAQAFLSATGRCVSPSILWECWPPKHDIVPRQPMDEVQAHITQCLDEVATRSPLNIAWDIFAWPDSNKNCWKEDCLPYSPGSMVDLSSRMLGIQLVLHDEAGKYQGVAQVLKFEGHMLVYDPQTNGVGWVAMRGVPSSLTEVESPSTSDLGNFYPSPSVAPAGPKASQSPPGEPAAEYEQTEAQSPNPTVVGLDKNIEWDTEDVEDQSHTPSPITIVDVPMQGEAGEETPPVRQNRCLVPERVIEPGVELPREHTPTMEGNQTPQNESVPADDKEQPHVIAEDEIVELYTGMEEL